MRSRATALYLLAGLTILAAVGAFTESANGVYHWGLDRGMPQWRAVMLPMFVDVFIAVGEIGLFVLAFYTIKKRAKIWPWLTLLLGLAASVAANMGDVWQTDWATRITWAVPPVAAAAALMVGLSVLKRIIEVHRAQPVKAAKPATARSGRPAGLPSQDRRAVAARPRLSPDALVGDEAALYTEAVNQIRQGNRPSERGFARRYLGDATRKRRAGTLIRLAERHVAAEPAIPVGNESR
jgi:hypothetical protein